MIILYGILGIIAFIIIAIILGIIGMAIVDLIGDGTVYFDYSIIEYIVSGLWIMLILLIFLGVGIITKNLILNIF